ncbi:C4-dicarboxylate ABC transporter permease [Natronococcus pandeyae]|uniref:C4-dicarboxylate ABC transporter permease n=1 Tax=Natronococcus pandeyae TaxID=2055836 RepID=A0A8J8Q466_9EURY|nr:TRAP transporter fused permease subunit [Natronococcus pandeyae]TYL36810.1 C4-dicarboxylate ABC transporter permease [Natronococcus pandeyae]
MSESSSSTTETAGTERRLSPFSVLDGAVSVLAVVFTLYTIYYAYSLMFVRLRYSNIFLGLGIALYYLDVARRHYEPEDGDVDEIDSEPRPSVIDTDSITPIQRLKLAFARIDPVVAILFAGIALAATGYVEYHFTRLEQDVHLLGHTQMDLYVGIALIVLVIDATRRAFGNVIASVAVASIIYAHAYVGPNLPGVFRHTGFDWTRISRQGAIELTGVYHETLMGIGSTWVAIFIMFAGIAKAYGLMDFVLDVGRELGKTLRTGVVQIAVIASMIMGSITGSAAANTATTGSFTIPMLKDQGVDDDFAASIEAVASAGGQMLPPVMGVAAFLMADLLGVSYVSIIQAGVIPAALFYFSVGVGIHFAVLKYGWTSPNTDSFDPRMLLGGLHFVIPLGVLLVTLVYLRYTPLTAGLYTIVTIFVVGSMKTAFTSARNSDLDVESAGALVKQAVSGLRTGGLEMAPLVGVLASMGVIIEMVTFTGLSTRVSTTIIGMGGGELVIVLILAMIASIMFGLGMPTPAAYILVVVLVAPGVIEMGVPEITTHMFVFYFAMLSAITPPVAISVAIGSRIAGSSFMKSCVQALRLGAPGFVIPFAFVTNNSLIYWSQETVIVFPVVLAGTIGLIVATVGFDGARDLSYPVRGLYLGAAFAGMFGSLVHVGVQIAAAAVIIAALVHARMVVGYDVDRAADPTLD